MTVRFGDTLNHQHTILPLPYTATPGNMSGGMIFAAARRIADF